MTSGKQAARGWTYLMLLWWVAISSMMLMALARSWTLQSQRQKEAELVFRGEQFQAAVTSYLQSGNPPQAYPPTLEALLEDRRGPVIKRHLRQLWTDPITGSPAWGLIKDEQDGIHGVYSLSLREPLGAPSGVDRYIDWRFEVND
jgi:type II secretory pathway pseudopilin PulG